MPNHSMWLQSNEGLRIVEEGDSGFRLMLGNGSDHDTLRITRQHGELMLAQLHRLFGLSPAVVESGNALDAAYEAVNALGGTSDGSSYDEGYGDGIGLSLDVITKLGGMDPAIRRSINSQERAVA